MFSKTLPAGLYCITAEEFSNGRKNTAVVCEMLKGGVKIVQYREKGDKSIREKYRECREIRKMTRDSGALFIVNDFIDIAILTDADGVHIGQDDLPVADVRKLVGDKMIGLSTHSPEQAQAALKDGADYIGVGPIYRTFTKKNVCDPVGLGYLDYVAGNMNIPFVAIGGIKEHNIIEVLKHGAKTVSLVTEIVGAQDIAGTARRVLQLMKDYRS